ncbi:hypothetical protein QVD17_03394 [Tagetes erecta]|uniref:cytidine deaminase n=1 Tax=Tagetes erecta TaxID=13708 RepID=A0AAD8L897_TARER|nr:hypothetical protein QVD17_03394 [Tagetes erecta]
MKQGAGASRKYIIEAKEAETMAKSKNLTLPQLLPSLIKTAKNLARPPISNFAVGVVGLVSDGRIFLGANIEFTGLPLHHTIHGEQFLITNVAANAAGSKLLYIAVSAAPCGHCRQFFQELRGISETQIVITDQPLENPAYKPFSSILPHAFGPYDLLDHDAPLILDKRNNELLIKDGDLIAGNGNIKIGCHNHVLLKNDNGSSVTTKALDSSSGGHNQLLFNNLIDKNGNKVPYTSHLSFKDKDDNFAKLMKEALEAARGSYAPYSGSPSGVALMDSEGKVYKGSYMESAAFNPSMMAVQAALVAYMVAGGGAYDRIVAAVLVEKEEAVVRQEETVRLFIKHISPECHVRVVHCK